MKSLSDLAALREKAIVAMDNTKSGKTKVLIGYATCGIAAGANPVVDVFEKAIADDKLDNVVLTKVGCIGMCRLEPMLDVIDPDGTTTTYVRVDADVARKIVDRHIKNGEIVTECIVGAADKQ